MVIEIPRSLLVQEPWTTATVGGKQNTRPVVVSLSSENPQGIELVELINQAPTLVNTFRVVDGMGPCYEFKGTALINNDLLTLNVEGALTFLR